MASTTQKSTEDHKKDHLEKIKNEKLRQIRENKEKSVTPKTPVPKPTEKAPPKPAPKPPKTAESTKDDTPIVDLLKQTATPGGGGHWKKRLKEANKETLKPQPSKISPDKPSTLLNLITSTPTPEIAKPANQKAPLAEKSPLAKKLPAEPPTIPAPIKPPTKHAEPPAPLVQKENLATAQIRAPIYF